MWFLFCLAWLGFFAWIGLTTQGGDWATKTWAWFDPYDFTQGYIWGPAMRAEKELRARHLANRIAANKERVAKRQAQERRESCLRTRPIVPYRANDMGGFNTGMPVVEAYITGGVMEAPERFNTRRPGARLKVATEAKPEDDRTDAEFKSGH